MWELKKVKGMQETHQLHIWGMVYCGSSWALRTYDVPSSAAGLSWIIGVSCALQGRSHTKYKKQYCIKGTASVLCRCEVKSLPISNLRVERIRAWTGVLKKKLEYHVLELGCFVLKQYPVLELGCFVLKQFFVFSLTGQVNAKKGENMHTKESTFLQLSLVGSFVCKQQYFRRHLQITHERKVRNKQLLLKGNILKL